MRKSVFPFRHTRPVLAVGFVGVFAAAPLAGQAVGGVLPVGEKMEFGVQFGPIQLGRSELAIAGREVVDGVEVYRLEVDFLAPIPFFRIHDRQTSWVLGDPLRSLRFDRYIHEGRMRTGWRYHLDGADRRLRVEPLEYEGADPANAEEPEVPPGTLLPEAPLDDLAVLLEMRRRIGTGETSFRIDRYFLGEETPAEFTLERRDRTRVPAGRFDVFVLRSVVPGMEMFRPESDARIHVGVEPPHPIVMITTETRQGRLTLYLREFRPGT